MAKPDAKTSAKNSQKEKKSFEPEVTQILTGYDAIRKELERIQDIIVYNILRKLVGYFENWETTLKALDSPPVTLPSGKELKWCRHSIPNLKKARSKLKAKNTQTKTNLLKHPSVQKKAKNTSRNKDHDKDNKEFFIPEGKELKWYRHSIPHLKKAQSKPKAKNTLNKKKSGKTVEESAYLEEGKEFLKEQKTK
ncbi:hypothetical protein RhiirA4_475537 [Rhizophagus irregularis]|uniref:Uncharacterized protein n=1 Tax=Rhizophagus irregularis TaxID=588596 RepID=A0A2I1HA95_9GLOM|nr:hypothetical protein RhiirA4_475537 [Rhizophagus irregularis]